MCGISGIFSFTGGEICEEQLIRMNRALRHRGPDSEGFYISPSLSAGLAHRRLSILDLSPAGHQPMSNEDGTVWIVFNGEIYNYETLRDELKENHLFRSNTDTEVILHLYEEQGTRCINALRGMFAFAIWDDNFKRLFLARDRVGKKPLYYAESAGKLYFASEINSLFEIGSIKREIDPSALDYFLTYSYIPSPHSIFRQIKKLPPAHFLLRSSEGVTIKRYWRLEFSPKIQLAYDEAKSLIIDKLEEATRIRLRSDVPLGCFLSGGVDSSTITALMSRLNSSPVKTFSISFKDSAYDEASYARTVAQFYHTDHQEFTVKADAVEILPELVRHYGEPYGDSSALPTWYLSQMTRKHVTVALNGDGGDELFAGYNWYGTGYDLYRLSRICPGFLVRFCSMMPNGSSGFFRRMKRVCSLLDKSNALRFADLRCLLGCGLKQDIYKKEFTASLERSAESYVAEFYDEGPCETEFDRMLYADTMTYLPEELLVKVDRATMAHSLEGRSPFLDHELMEFVARLPFDFKYRHGETKYILKDAVKNLFPPGFLDRPKMGFSVPLGKWFKKDLKTYVESKICNGALKNNPFLKMEPVKNILVEHFESRKNHESLIWNLLILSEWMEKYY